MALNSKKVWKNRQVLSWGLYDWANSAFATTVMAGFFPLFFKQYWAADLAAGDSTFLLGSFNALASMVVVLLAPLLGASAARSSARNRFLRYFAMMGVVMTGALYRFAAGG